MKDAPITLLKRAEGEIPTQAFTGEQNGLFSGRYLSGKSVYEWLEDNEEIHYLLTNRSDGVSIEHHNGDSTDEFTPDGRFRALAAVTDCRVFFLIGEEAGDTFIELDGTEITEMALESSLLSTKVIFQTETSAYTFGVNKRRSSDPGAAVEYIKQNLVNSEPPESDGNSVSDSLGEESQPVSKPQGVTQQVKETDSDTSDQEAESADEDSISTSDDTESALVSDSERVSDDTHSQLETALRTIDESDPSSDDLNDAISSLESAKKSLQDVKEDPGVEREMVDEAIEQVDSKLNPLLQIRTTYAEAKRQFALSKGGMKSSEAKLEKLHSSVTEAIKLAEKIGRSAGKLEEYRTQLEEKLDAKKAASQSGSGGSSRSQSKNAQQNGKRSRYTSQSSGTKYTTSLREREEENSVDDDSGFNFGEDIHEPSTEVDVDTANPVEPTRDDLKEDLHRIAEEIGHRPSMADILKRAKYDSRTFVSEFGSCEEAISVAFDDNTADEEDDDGEDEDEASMATGQSNVPIRGTSKLDNTEEEIEEREQLIREIERISEELQKRPTTTEFDSNANYSTSDVYLHFDSWDDAIDAADIEFASRQDLIEEIKRLHSTLGYPPLSTHVNEHAKFSAYDYQQEFGSVDAAVKEAGFDVESRVREDIKKLISSSDGTLGWADFGDRSPYSSGIIYKFFDSWNDAVASVKPVVSDDEDQSDVEKGSQKSSENPNTPKQNELSERYELLRNLRTLCNIAISACEEFSEDEEEPPDPMIQWADEVEDFWTSGPEGADNYGHQQNNRNPFSMSSYRKNFGNRVAGFGGGTRVTEFKYAESSRPSRTVRALLEPFTDADLSECFLPVDSHSGAPFPVIVESEDELERAVDMLDRLPAEPSAAVDTSESTDSDDEEEEEDEAGGSNSSEGTDVEQVETDLTEVSGVTEEIAAYLQDSGYRTRDDLKRASMDELADVSGINKQIVNRIKLDVGE